jgi:hypothetical protein
MRLNAVETALMNNPIRAAIQRRYEAERLLGMGGPHSSWARTCDEAGCTLLAATMPAASH